MQIRKHLMERSSVQEFADSISRYIDASTGVIHVRTAEVLRCATELRKVLVANDCIHYEWDIATGMKQIRETEIAKINIEGDGDINFLSAFNKPWARVLSGINGTIHADEIGKMAVFTYISPDPWMDGVPLVRHLVEKYATVLPSHDVRCVIITRDAPLPDNLSEMVGTCRFDTPSYSELEGFYEGIIESVRDENILSPMSEEDVRRVCFAGAGLTRERFDTHLSSAIVNGVRNLDEDGLLTVDDLVAGVSVGKTEVVNTSDLLELYPEESMANVGGMDVLKQWIDKRKSCYSDEAVAFGIEPPKGIVFVGPPGCQPAGSKVLMADGLFHNIEDVVAGDIVLSPQHDGSVIPVEVAETVIYRQQRVYNVISRGRNPVSYRCAHNHVMPLKMHGNLHELQAEEFLSTGKWFQDRATLFTTDAYDLPEQEYRIHPYVLGAFIGDGHFARNAPTYNPSFTNPNLPIYARMEANGAEFGKKVWKSGCWRANAVGAFAQTLKEFELAGRLSKDKYVPAEYLKGSLMQRLELLAGLIDTDGTFEEFSSSSEQLAKDFSFLVRSVGGKSSLSERRTSCQTGTYTSFRVHYSFGACRPILSLPHKQRPITEKGLAGHRNRRFVLAEDGVEDVYGIRLASGSHWYITDDFIVTKNTGKSLVSKAISKQLGVPLVRFDFGRVFNSLVGKSEERIREALRMVESMAPCVLFIDEIDKGLAGMGGSGGDSGTSARVFGTFLTWLNDTQAPVFTVVTANNVTHLPPELMRKGRFDQIFTSGLPDRTDLKAVFDIHMRKRGWSFDAYTADEQLECINRVVGFVPAEVEAVVKDALIDAFNEGAKEPTVAHILAAADNTVPLIKSHTMDMIATMLWCKENGVPASTYTILDASEEGEVASKQDDKVVVNIDKARSVRARRRTTRK